ncbi:MAG: hypothetical protein WBG95_00400 [Sulfitobacter sp.]
MRPTRIGFLVHPSDKKSLKQIFRINTSIWGGIFNPIIPVFSRPPDCWKDDHKPDRSHSVSKGYLRYFEPDVFVEAEHGLAEKVGLPPEFRESFRSKVVALQDFWDNRQWGADGPRLGLSISGVLRKSYDTERKFVLREDHRDHFQTYKGSECQLAAAALFGNLLDQGSAKYLHQDYDYIYKPVVVEDFKQAWRNRTFDQYASELVLTGDGLDLSHFGAKQPTFFLFDPSSTHDLIDYWNLRAQALGRVHPVPIDFWQDCKEELAALAERYYVPANGNRFERGTTLEISRSASSDSFLRSLQEEAATWKKGLFSIKNWRDRIWEGHSRNRSSVGVDVSRPYAAEKSQILKQDDEQYLRFDTLDPEFSDSAVHNDYSWVNVLLISDRHHHDGIATTLPFNVMSNVRWRLTFDDKTIVNSEGWCLPQRYSSIGETLEKHPPLHYFQTFFKAAGFSVGQSEAGMIAQQMFASLSKESSGLNATGIFSSAERLNFFNRYAMGQRVRSNGDMVKEESFPSRSIGLEDVEVHIKRYGKNGISRKSLLSRLIAYNVLQLGVEVKCPHCFSENWFDLDTVKYSLRCELCRKDFDFPQDGINKRSGNWKYRLTGPFATPDYARGAYSTLLTARLLSEIGGNDDQLTFSLGVELKSKNGNHESDLVCWLRERGHFQVLNDPTLVFAECKSFAAEALKPIDFKRMASLWKQFPDAALVFSVLKESFSEDELAQAKAFLKRYAGQLRYGSYERPVIFLTGKDLFFDYTLTGGDDARYSFNDENTLSEFASASQRLNLGLHK